MKNTIYVALLSLFVFGGSAQGQSVVQATSVKLQPQIGRDEIGYSTCGVHAVVLDVQSSIVDVYDFSLNIQSNLFSGLMKAGKMQVSMKDMLANKMPTKAILPAPVTFWISKESDGVALRPQKVIAAETPGYILAGADLAKTYEILLAIVTGERIQFATRYQNQGLDTVVSFGAAMPEAELGPLMACVTGVTARFKQQLDGPPK